MTDPSADRPLLLPEKIFSEEDIQLVADALTASNARRWEEQLPVPAWCDLATAALHALATAGRLLPPSAEHREEWRVQRMDIESHKWEPYLMENRADAERFCEDAVWGEHARVERREIVTWVGPWVEVDGSQPDAP